FEPPVQLPVHRISSAARSTTPASLRICNPRNRRFGTANIDIIFNNVHFPAKKIIRKPKKQPDYPDISSLRPAAFLLVRNENPEK
ncbi:MAG: hypothetical protein K2I32_08840, partial [Alistipes sp.]|nr:hypothetical protein [Alistipes sp.]